MISGETLKGPSRMLDLGGSKEHGGGRGWRESTAKQKGAERIEGGENPGQKREKRRTNQTGEEEAKGRRWIQRRTKGGREEGRKEGRKEMVVEVGECRAIRAKAEGGP